MNNIHIHTFPERPAAIIDVHAAQFLNMDITRLRRQIRSCLRQTYRQHEFFEFTPAEVEKILNKHPDMPRPIYGITRDGIQTLLTCNIAFTRAINIYTDTQRRLKAINHAFGIRADHPQRSIEYPVKLGYFGDRPIRILEIPQYNGELIPGPDLAKALELSRSQAYAPLYEWPEIFKEQIVHAKGGEIIKAIREAIASCGWEFKATSICLFTLEGASRLALFSSSAAGSELARWLTRYRAGLIQLFVPYRRQAACQQRHTIPDNCHPNC
jgi:hypothetical protein